MRLVVGISLALLASGCVSAKVQRLDNVSRPQRSSEAVRLLLEKPNTPYTVIAVVESKTETILQDFDDLREKIRAEAALLGGDAVILGTEGSESTMLITATGQIHSDRKKLTGEVIVFPHPKGGVR